MASDRRPIKRALLSVSDKTGLADFAAFLAARGVELISTGGTRRDLLAHGLEVLDVADVTGFPELMDGRLKTLHPNIHGGLLAIRENPAHEAAMLAHAIKPIDLLIVNLYPFEATVAAGGDYESCIETIDIGGPAMIRGAAKNHGDVTVVVDVADYAAIEAELETHEGATTAMFRRRMAQKALARTAAYDAAISNWLAGTIPSSEAPRFRALGGYARRGTALRREPAPGRRLLPDARGAGRGGHGPAGAGQARCPTTTSPIPTPPSNSSLSSIPARARPSPSSSTPTPAARPWAARLWRPIAGRWPATPSRPSEALSPRIGRWTPTPPGRS